MKIQEIIAKDNLIIFAGAGLSRNLNLPTWNQMVIDIIKKVDKKELEPFIPLLNTNMLTALEVLDKMKNVRKEVYDYVRNNFEVTSESDLSLQKKLLQLSNNKVITTNYDNAFEMASNNKIKPSNPSSKYTINNVNKGDDGFIFKLHGSFDTPDHCIIYNEDYEKFYSSSNNEAAPEKLKSLFSNLTFLFVGFGFNDPDIDLIFDKMNKTFGGFNKHFILTPDPAKFEKYEFLETVKLEDYSHLESKIDELVKIKNEIAPIKLNDHKITYNVENSAKKIAVLYPDIIDQSSAEEYRSTITLFDSIEADILIGYLNLDTLNLVDDYDLLIIISNIYKGNIYVEDKNLKSTLVNINDITDNIPNSNIPLLLLTNEEIDISGTNHPILNIFDFKNQTIKRFLHKILTEKTFLFNDTKIKKNSLEWIVQFEKGKAKKSNFYGNNRNLDIGKKCLSEVIGRIEEQSNLITRLQLINKSNKILNIKASGGLGKTTLVKKVSYELYNRGHYKNGVNFKSCEKVKSFDDFEELVIEGFNFKDIINFREHLIENYSNEKIDLLLILDNFETVINNLIVEDYVKVIEFLEFVSDYSNLVITSRDIIGNNEFEEVFNLTPMTTDDALQLFKENYKKNQNYSNQEIKILRQEILEDLLANNPLAIKLVTTSRPAMRIEQLRDQIKDNFFESINEEYSDVFKNNADLNLERSKSIFQSINYSYSSLNARQKLAFELLSLFPDGINLSDFKKCFKKNKSNNSISDNEIKQLENKSLLENYNGVLQLQPIIRRFADFQFDKHKDNKERYCVDAYSYNCYILEILIDILNGKSKSRALNLFAQVKNNLLLVLEYIPFIKIDENGSVPKKQYLLNYVYDLEDFLTNGKNLSYFESNLTNLIEYFEEVEFSRELIDVIIHRANYYQNEFDYSYIEMTKMLSVQQMEERDYKNEEHNEQNWKDLIMNIHSMEGFTINFLKSLIKNKTYNRRLYSEYHYLGLENISFIKKNSLFYYNENLVRNNSLDIDELVADIDNFYMEEHLQIMQCTYTLSKVKKIPLKNIKKLVVTNPYTRGLKNLMFAFNTDNKEDKLEYFKAALNNLKHIKYYYLEALYYYSKFLKDIKSELYNETVLKGLELSQRHKYQYLDHLFNNLFLNQNYKYSFSYDYYELSGLEDYINKHKEELKKLKVI